MNDSYKEILAKQIRSQTEWVVNDSRTFAWVKSKYRVFAHIAVGGGNLMMANSGFSALNYLAKANSILETKSADFRNFSPFISSTGERKSKEFYKSLKYR
jgi:hypothetical protein